MKYIIGIDEVGRGSIAGPVTVAALAAPVNLRFKISDLRFVRGRKKSEILYNNKSKMVLRDSKKLSPKQRGKWFAWIKQCPKIFYAIAHIQPSVVDRINISKAANRAASKALTKLLANKELRITSKAKIFLDGGLHVSDSLLASRYTPTTVIRGDEKIPAIALASIVAKVTRDRLMRRIDKKFPKYSFGIHKGYGTKAHFAAVRKFGASAKHRLTFI